MVFFYLVTTGWIFEISLCENAIKSINKMLYNIWICGVKIIHISIYTADVRITCLHIYSRLLLLTQEHR